MEVKSTYSEAEIDEVAEWFAARRDRLPQELQLNKATRLDNLPRTVEKLIELGHMQRENATFGVEIHLLFEIRDCLLAREQAE